MGQEQRCLHRIGPPPAPDNRLGAGQVEVGGLQQEQRKEQERLVAGDEPDKTPLVAGLPDGERQDGDADVGVEVFVVGVAVVAAWPTNAIWVKTTAR